MAREKPEEKPRVRLRVIATHEETVFTAEPPGNRVVVVTFRGPRGPPLQVRIPKAEYSREAMEKAIRARWEQWLREQPFDVEV